MDQKNSTSGIVIAALRGGSGKTMISLGIISALRQKGLCVAPYKKGPDYIDAGWLALAAGRPCYNLDTFLIDPPQILHSFCSRTQPGDIAVVEGNRGLYDCINTEGATSTAALARQLGLPVILCLDCTKTTRTMAAVVSGCMAFEPEVRIRGVVLNRVAGARHERILRESIEGHCGIPVVGAVPKLSGENFPERHMGLVPTPEHRWAQDSLEAVTRMALAHLDVDAIVRLARETGCPEAEAGRGEAGDGARPVISADSPRPRIGVIRDSAFQFYYPENIEALEAAGAEVVAFSPLTQPGLPEVDALYIGGGFPETHAEALAENRSFSREVKAAAESGLPIYAECGGLMYLGEDLTLEGRSYPMAGVLPVAFGLSRKPQGHGYTLMKVTAKNPYYPVGMQLKGHEFHYSRVVRWTGSEKDLVFSVQRGKGITGGRDGLCFRNVLATYTHVHALGTPRWAEGMVHAAARHKDQKKGGQSDV